MKKILMLVRNEVDNDPRVYKMARSLHDHDFEIQVNCFVNTIGNKPVFETKKEFKVKRFQSGVQKARKIINTQTKYMSGNRTRIDKTSLAFIYILYLNIKFFMYSIRDRADIYHANDLDTLLCGYLLSIVHRSKLVYDSHELFDEMYSDYTPMLKRLYRALDRFLMCKCNLVITVNESIAETFYERYGVYVEVVMNCPYYQHIHHVGRDGSNVKVIYIGSYQEERCLEELIESVKYWNSGVLYMRGWGGLEQKLRDLSDSLGISHKVVFLDPVPMPDIVQSLVDFDIGIVPYPAINLNNKYSTPNKFFEYLMAGVVPVVSADLVELKKITSNFKIWSGAFDPYDPQSIARSINILSDMRSVRVDGVEYSSMLDYISNDCLKLSRFKYNWDNQFLNIIEKYNRL